MERVGGRAGRAGDPSRRSGQLDVTPLVLVLFAASGVSLLARLATELLDLPVDAVRAVVAVTLATTLWSATRQLRELAGWTAADILIEGAIVAGLVGSLVWLIAVEPTMRDRSQQLAGTLAPLVTFVAGVITAVVLVWMASVTPGRRWRRAAIIAFGLVVLAHAAVWLAESTDYVPPAWVDELLLGCFAVTAIAAAMAQRSSTPQRTEHLTAKRRYAPIIVAVTSLPMLTGIVVDRSGDVSAVVASAILTLLVILYLARVADRLTLAERLIEVDELTALPNRRQFERRLDESLRSAGTTDDRVAVLFIDLDRFKLVNDSLGHEAGNVLLRTAAQRLRRCARSTDVVARLGGDEFAVILCSGDDDAAHDTAERIVRAFRQPFVIHGREAYVTASVGVARAEDHQDASSLLGTADAAMYRAKRRGRGRAEELTPPSSHRPWDPLELETELHHAIDRNQLVLHYQPRIDIASGDVVGAEALVRWNHPTWGLIAPDDFIPIAEESSLIAEIGEWVLLHACTLASRWRDVDERFAISVNVSARQFEIQSIADVVASVLRRTRLDPFGLELELTEGVVLGDLDHVRSVLSDLSAMGVGCSIDDFGTGYSSLRYLEHFPLSALKIDRTFITSVTEHTPTSPIVTAVISLAHGLGLNIVAEGIETETQASYVLQQGCRFGQGFLFSRPLGEHDFADYLTSLEWTARARRDRHESRDHVRDFLATLELPTIVTPAALASSRPPR